MEAVQAIAAIDVVENLPRRRIKLYNARADPFSLPDVEFRSRYRFQKDTMNYIIDLVRDDIVVDQRGCGTTPELQVLTAIRCWGRREVQDDAGELHGLSQPTVICDATLQIMDLVARWRGSTHDSRIFTESSIKQRFERREFRGRLLGDSGYRLEPYLFTPITRPQNVAEEHYSEAHISTRNTIERCFGVWKQRFQCLLHGMSVKMENIKPTIVALAILHNIAIKREGQIDFDAEEQLHHPALPEEDAHIEGGHRANINNAFLRAFVARHFNN
ncbi:unnamed protein product [Plutella xylostella]|uniref:(diamondback moth) hypothetical protein n=1 Tax=Plutella xylostella TaxID=51655 RepID=A0A8S4GGY4_PLUXY|nr:unnamed protein product [Plutella xylostella]